MSQRRASLFGVVLALALAVSPATRASADESSCMDFVWSGSCMFAYGGGNITVVGVVAGSVLSVTTGTGQFCIAMSYACYYYPTVSPSVSIPSIQVTVSRAVDGSYVTSCGSVIGGVCSETPAAVAVGEELVCSVSVGSLAGTFGCFS